MQSALHQYLIAAQFYGLSNFIQQFGSGKNISLVAFRRSIKGAEIADRSADVRVIDVPINIVRSVRLRMFPETYLVRSFADLC
jgi:hypothetical protein